MPNCIPITISVEIESPRSGTRLLDLLPYVDVAFIGKEFAKNLGFNNMSDVIRYIGQDAKGAIICAWAEEGAMARHPSGAIVQSPAFPPKKVIDTLGASDTFNAAAMYYLNKNKIEFMHKYKKEAACANNTNLMKDISNDDTVVKRDIQENLNLKSLGYGSKFITDTILQKTIKFACCIAGAKVGLRGFDNLDVISRDILQLDFLEN